MDRNQRIEAIRDLMADWPYQDKENPFVFDSSADYWKLHRFRFPNFLYSIPFRTRSARFDPILDDKPDPIHIRIRTKIIYLLISMYFYLVAFYLFVRACTPRQKPCRQGSVLYITHESNISVIDGKVKDIYMLQGVRGKVSAARLGECILVSSPWLKPWKKPKPGNYILLNDQGSIRLYRTAWNDTVSIVKAFRGRKWDRNFNIAGKSIYRFLEDDLSFLFSFPMVFLNIYYYHLMKHVMESLHIKIVVTVSGHYERAALAAADRLGIPSVFIAHSPISNGKFFDFYPGTNYFVYGERDKDILTRDSGIPPHRIVVTGATNIDALVSKYRSSTNRKKKTILFLSQQLYLFFGDQRYQEHLEKIFSNLSDIDARLVVKLHPRDQKPHLIENALKHEGIKDYRIVRTDASNKNQEVLYREISRSDVVMTFFSTTILDALVLGKPVIMVRVTDEEYFTELKSVMRVPYDGDIRSVLKSMLFDKGYMLNVKDLVRQDIRKYYYKADGLACQRAAHAIRKMV